ncbi:amino acid permease [uncultured Sphingomonas sp.]|uniref:amino acid permease n=1 Tax=uncultured Sphingomonas sp. TaxID=158754 RepID=UPI0025E26B51|nr:amino acid permease [uncultured Sphingomonas sp.]
MAPDGGALHRRLSSGQLAMIAIGGAIGTGLFLGSGLAIGLAGPAVLISYAIGGVIALLLMGCLAEMTVAHPTSGAFGDLAELYLGSWAGFVVRYAYWSALVLAVGTELTAVAIYMQFWLPTVPGWIWMLFFGVALLLVNAASVGLFGRIEYAFSAIKIVAILGFLLLGSLVVARAPAGSAIGLANYVSHGGFFPHGSGGLWSAVIVSIFSYLGIEMIAVAAGEAVDPERAIVRAFRATMLRLAIFYLGTLALMLAIVPWTEAGTASSPFVAVMLAIGIPGGAGVLNAVVLIAALSAMNSQLYTATRMLYSLARAGQAPRSLGRLSANGVPLMALLASALGIAPATLLYLYQPQQAFGVMIGISAFGAMFAWMMIFLTHLAFRARSGPRAQAFRMWGYPLTSVAGATAMAAILLTTPFTGPFASTLLYGVPFLLLLSLSYLLVRRSGPRNFRRE